MVALFVLVKGGKTEINQHPFAFFLVIEYVFGF